MAAATETWHDRWVYKWQSLYDRDKGAGSSAFRSWDGDTFIVETDDRHKGHAFTVIERTRLEGNGLIYKHEVTGPGDKRDEREVVFELS